MIARSAEPQRAIKVEKAALLDNLTALENKARNLTDWRAQVAKHPWQSLGVAVAAGAVLGLLVGRPRASAERSADDESDGATTPGARHHPRSAMIDRVVNAVVGVAAAQAMEVLDEVVPGLAGAVTRKMDGTQHSYSTGNSQND